MDIVTIVVGTILGLLLGFAASFFGSKNSVNSKIKEAQEEAKRILEEAAKEAKNEKKERMLEVKEEWHQKKQEFENEYQAKRNKLNGLEKNIKSREDSINSKLEVIGKKERQMQLLEKDILQKTAVVNQKLNEAQQLQVEQTNRLERITGMSREDAKKFLIENMINDAKLEGAQAIKDIRDEYKIAAIKESQKIVIQAIQRTASDHTQDNSVSVVNLASEEMKGRIIGREGRNIRAFEAATGIDLIIDDTPEAVVVSGFDQFRREVAKVALEKLMNDGRIHPARIEEVVEKTRQELEIEIVRIGENTALEMGIHNLHPELIKYVGKMRYRSSYGQNLLKHSIEVSYLCGIMASELGLDVHMAKRAALLHDIGKCVDRNTEGPHAILGYDLAKKYKEHHLVCNAIGAHHDEMEMESPIAVLVQAADSISGSRPGARRESLENYVKRLEKLEEIANGFDGVTKTFAIQAGREVRVIVEPDRVDDLTADTLAHDIASRIENEMEYPGQIKVMIIRERRSMAIAK